jgi:chromosome segregation ATPase
MELPVENVNIFNTIITDIQAVQTRYDGMIITLNNRLKKTQGENIRLTQQIRDLDEEAEALRQEKESAMKTTAKVTIENKTLSEINSDLQSQTETLKNKIHELEKTIKTLQDDHKEFSKVSHVVALEKENSKLRQELYKKRLVEDKIQEEPPPQKNSSTTDNVPESPRKQAQEHQHAGDEEQTVDDVYEKRIKGKTYFVSSIDKSVFTKNEDGTIGEKVGTLERYGTKTKIVWA